MNVVDLVLLVAMLVFALTGWKRGFMYGLLSLVGFLAGAAVGLWLAPLVVSSWKPGIGKVVVAIGIVFLLASVGQVLLGYVGKRLKDAVTWKPALTLDSMGGSVLSVVAMLLVVWFAANMLVHSTSLPFAQDIRQSRVLGFVDSLMPDRARVLAGSFQTALNDSGFPDVFAGLGPEPVKPVARPNPKVLDDPQVVAAQASVVKVNGVAPSCSRRIEGSGFVYAPGRVMTNAHVVAGVPSPQVQVGGGRTYAATVVVFDPVRDIAVLAVKELTRPALPFAAGAQRSQSVAVVGYPQNGPLTTVPGRVRGEISAQGHDIYGQQAVSRDVYSLRAAVRHGNSGGPVVDLDGDVVGMVFAASLDQPDTGYALTATEVSGDASRGIAATSRVSTGGCV